MITDGFSAWLDSATRVQKQKSGRQIAGVLSYIQLFPYPHFMPQLRLHVIIFTEPSHFFPLLNLWSHPFGNKDCNSWVVCVFVSPWMEGFVNVCVPVFLLKVSSLWVEQLSFPGSLGLRLT